ncbi:MAG: alpha/beta hydrolase [Chloroflexi bacterium]|nr:alpha/beta hydrolase [Chloroflexota bacterium]
MKDMRINAGEIELQVRDYPNAGDAILFLHYGGGNMVMWQDVVPFFRDDFHIVLVDLRGHGKSDKPKEGYHIDVMAEDVVKVLEFLGIEKAHVVGSSLGAEVGLSLAANHPDKVRSLVCEGALFNEWGPYGLCEGTQAAFEVHAKEKLESLRNRQENAYSSVDEMIAEKKKFFDKYNWWNETLEAVIRYDAIKREDGKYVESWGRIALQYEIHFMFYNFGEYYQRVQCPVLMMSDLYPGQDERELAIMDALFKLVKQGKIVRVPQWVHPYGWMITPEAGSRVVKAFLNEIQEK